MSQDDRIRQLTGLFLEDLRAPMEVSFHQLFEQVMAMAAEDLKAATDEAVARANADHQSALAEALAAVTRERDAALETLHDALAKEHETAIQAVRATLQTEHETGIEALRSELAAQHEDVVGADRAELHRQHQEALDALGTELALRHGEALDALRTQTAAEHETAVEELVRHREETIDTIRREAAAERDAAVQAAREELGREHETTVAALREQLQREHEATVAALREQLQREHEATAAALREQLQREHEEAAARDRETWAGQHETAMGDARAAAEATAAVAFAAVEQERDAARASVAELTDQLAVARAQHEQITQIAHAEADAAAEFAEGAVDVHVAERQSELACSERVVAAMRALDEARSLSEILTALADHAASQAVRVAVLLVHGTRLRGWRFAGMGDMEAAAVDVPVAQAAIIGRAVELGVAVSSSEAGALDATALPSFLATPAGRVGLALPIQVGGRVVAVLYADNGGSETPVVPSSWPELAEVLTRHAGRCLEVLTLSRAAAAIRPVQEWQTKTAPAEALHAEAGASPHVLSVKETEEQEEESARRHARLLISEIKLYNQELVERGRREGNLAALLDSEIVRARRLYEEKIPAGVRQRVDCFDEEIVRTLAGGDRTLLGQVT